MSCQRTFLNTSTLNVPAGRRTGRVETLPMGFWVVGRHSGEILPRLSFNVERKTPRKDSGEILYDSGGNQYPPECYRKVWNKNESPSTVKTTFFWSVFG